MVGKCESLVNSTKGSLWLCSVRMWQSSWHALFFICCCFLFYYYYLCVLGHDCILSRKEQLMSMIVFEMFRNYKYDIGMAHNKEVENFK